jgi:hypothetical protein
MDLAIAERYNISYDLVWFNREAFEADFNSSSSSSDMEVSLERYGKFRL